ncbi:MAG: amidohydrolase family protein [Deltaproteobacteria bacterium]|jgi:aminodeoxyfutalosine deaminase|nr:amidohydrolase family protein [Deltaproteobacteria bacterium]
MEIITSSIALPMTNGGPVIENGAIAVELGKIHEFGNFKDLREKYPDAEVKEHSGVLMPGLVNAHCHLDLVSLYETTMPKEDPLNDQIDFIDNLISSIDFKQDTDSKIIIDGIQRGVQRLIETGATCIGDMTHFEGTFKILREMGLRALVYPEILAGRGEIAQQSFEVAIALLEKYTDATHDRIRVGLGPYSPYLLSKNLLKIISQHAKDSSIPLVIHAAESFAEMEFFFDSEGPIATDVFPVMGWKELPPAHRKTPISFLSEIDFFEAPTTIVGGLHLSGTDFSHLARNLVKVVYCPTSNKAMKHGTFPLGKLAEHGIPVGLGTECWHSKLGFNMWEEMRLAIVRGSEPLPMPKDMLKMATIGSARALGLDHIIGTLEKGKKADYIVVHLPEYDMDNPDSLYAKLVELTDPQHVKQVVVNGNILKSI